jgi:5-hydroxyisourate hydrolase-like protein (transthyretin family)
MSGCGQRLEMVQGMVTLDGKPLEDVTVTFFATEGKEQGTIAFGRTNNKGEFTISMLYSKKYGKGTVVGKYAVSFSKDKFIRELTSQEMEAIKQGQQLNIETISALPEKYLSHQTSGFIVDIIKGKNIFNFELKTQEE